MNLSVLSTVLTLLPLGKGDPTWGDNPALTQQFLPAIWETLLMVFFGTFFTVLVGLPLGLLLVQTSKTGLTPNKTINQIVGLIVNVGRSFPFLILIIVLLPVTRFVMKNATTWPGATFPLVIGAIPFFARLVETNLFAVDNGKVEAALMAGASNRRIRWSVLVHEALPGIIQSVTVLAITLVGYSAMTSVVGAGGLGKMAIDYGYHRFQTDTMICSVVAIIIIVQVIQMVGDMLSRLVDHR